MPETEPPPTDQSHDTSRPHPSRRRYKPRQERRRSLGRRLLMGLGGRVLYMLFRIYLFTVRLKVVNRTQAEAKAAETGKGYILCSWHCNILIVVRTHHHRKMCALLSAHRDADPLEALLKPAGTHIVRGSTARGGIRAMRELVNAARRGYNFMIAVDGPRGPRHEVQIGAVFLAQKTGCPLMPAGIAWRRYWELKTWDRFRIPKPFTRAVGVCGDPIVVPPELDNQGREEYRQTLQRALEECEAEAERVLETL